MNEKLEKLTKEDLIIVIANMHETIEEWQEFFDKEDADKLNEIGLLCCKECWKNNNLDLRGL